MKPTGIPVLMYHALEDEQHPAGAKDQGEQLYVVSVRNFREQMHYLHTHGFQTCLLNDLLHLNPWPQRSVVITFDDGHESNALLALPILQEFKFHAEFFITTGWIGEKHFLTRNQIIELQKAGMAIGSHSVSHPYFNDLSQDKALEELTESRNTLVEITGNDIHGFSAPGGRLGQSTIEMAKKCGYCFLCTSTPNAFCKKSSAFSIPRFAVRKDTSFNEFIGIITLNSVLLNKIKIKANLLFYAKKLLGNNLYEKIRERFICPS
jgi:peptidoglycan/xylan/chitin deacetylase (PgdA/CDA1 family)